MRAGGPVAVVTAVLAALLPAATSAAAETTAVPTVVRSDPRGAGSEPLLDSREHGRRAVRLLGDRLGAAAARNHMSATALRRLLTEDDSAWLDRQGRIYFVDPPAGSVGASSPTVSAPTAALPYGETFELHSKPWSKRKIFLDFDGAYVGGTAWNEDSGLPDATYPGFSVDSAVEFSEVEQDVVQDVWARVAEDYAPFEVDVTTEDPTQPGLRRSDPDDPSYGIQVLVTSDAAARDFVCAGGCAGYAYYNSFDQVVEEPAPLALQPAWVFAEAVPRSADMADAASHEVGHTFGLSHDGLGSSPYHPGDGLWAPIMGAGYTPLTQFSNGDYTGSTNTEDDLALIASHGARLVSDDHGDDPGTATTLVGSAPTATGVIGARTDRDVFRLDRACDGGLQVDAVPGPRGPDLDIGLRVLDGHGAVLASASPVTEAGGSYTDPSASGLDAQVTLPSAAPGTYYVEVDGVGQAGYSDYGSLGPFTLTMTGCPGTSTSTAPERPLHLDVNVVRAAWAVDLTWQPPRYDGGSPVTGYDILLDGEPVVQGLSAAVHTFRFSDLTGLTDYSFGVRAVNAVGTSTAAETSETTPVLPPSEPLDLDVTVADLTPGSARVSWTPPSQMNGNTHLSYWIQRRGPDAAGAAEETYGPTSSSEWVLDGLLENTAYTIEMWATGDDSIEGRHSAPLTFVNQPAPPPVVTAPGPPRIGRASPGARGGTVTATARWWAPLATGGATITSYRVTALRMSTSGAVLRRTTVTVGGSVRARSMRLARGRYRFAVVAVNKAGASRWSARSNLVTAR